MSKLAFKSINFTHSVPFPRFGIARAVRSKCRISLIYCFLEDLLLTSNFNFNYFSFIFEVSDSLPIIYNYLYIN